MSSLDNYQGDGYVNRWGVTYNDFIPEPADINDITNIVTTFNSTTQSVTFVLQYNDGTMANRTIPLSSVWEQDIASVSSSLSGQTLYITLTRRNGTTVSDSVSLSVFATDATVTALSATVASLAGTVGVLVTDVAGLQTDVGILQGDVSALNGAVSALQGDVAGLESDVSSLQSSVSTINGKVNNCFDTVSYNGTSGLLNFTRVNNNTQGVTIHQSQWTDETGNVIAYSAGSVGIGTTIPTTTFDVFGTIHADYLSGDGSGITNLPSSPWQQITGGLYYNSGNVGIGTNLPIYPLHVEGQGFFTSNLTCQRLGANVNPDTWPSPWIQAGALTYPYVSSEFALSVNGHSMFNGNLIPARQPNPSLGEGYDLGSYFNRWKDLYLSGSTIYLGDTRLTRDAATGGLNVVDNTSGQEVDISTKDVLTSNIFLGGGQTQWNTYPDSVKYYSLWSSNSMYCHSNIKAMAFIGDGSQLTNLPTQSNLTTLTNNITYNAGSDLWMITENNSNLRLPTSLYISSNMYIQGTLTQGYDTTLIKAGSQPTRNIYWERGTDGDNVITTKNIYIDGNLYIQGNLSVNENLSACNVITPSSPTTSNEYVQWQRITDGTQNNHGTYTDKKVMVKANVFVKGTVYQSIPFSSLDVVPNSLTPYIKIGERNIADGAVQYNHLENTLLQFFKSFVGQVAYYAMNTPPVGWLVCDGSLLIRTDYTNLFAVINTTYGTTGSTNFRLPDLRGEFLRGWDNGRGVDAGRSFASFQDHQFQDHVHGTNIKGDVPAGGSADCYRVGDGNTLTGGAKTGNRGTETRPRNMALLPCIKY